MDEAPAGRKRKNAVRTTALWALVVLSIAGVVLVGLFKTPGGGTAAEPQREIPGESPRADHLRDQALGAFADVRQVAARLVAHAAAGRWDEAHALLATPARQAIRQDKLQAIWSGSPLLRAAQTVTLRTTTLDTLPGDDGAPSSSSMSARGVLVTSAGTVDVAFTFLLEGGQARVLTFLVAGVPVLDGVRGSAPR